jgi:sec-independent protein translocase protein TatB
MFDIGFWELVVIGVVALLVIGPERLPAVARTAGVWVGRARRFISTVQSDIHQEINKSEELQRLLEEQSKIKEMHEIIEHTVDETRKTIPIGSNDSGRAVETMEDVDSGLPAHEPRSLDDSAPETDQSGQEQVARDTERTHDIESDKAKPASATDAVNESAK